MAAVDAIEGRLKGGDAIESGDMVAKVVVDAIGTGFGAVETEVEAIKGRIMGVEAIEEGGRVAKEEVEAVGMWFVAVETEVEAIRGTCESRDSKSVAGTELKISCVLDWGLPA